MERPSGPGWPSKGRVWWDGASPPASSRLEGGVEDSGLLGTALAEWGMGQGVRKGRLQAACLTRV